MRNLYNDCIVELREMIPDSQYEEIVTQHGCEYDLDFLGFAHIYKNLSEIIPKEHIVIDFGCYLAVQSYFFKDHEKYIGVDTESLKRFKPDNATHYVCSIQDFIKNESGNLLKEYKNHRIFAICSFVPDFEAAKLVRDTFENVFCYYPF